jgi:hypothetical protein
VETNIRKNLEYLDTLYIIASDETAKRKVIQVALKTLFRLRKEKPNANLRVEVASIDELKKSQFGFPGFYEIYQKNLKREVGKFKKRGG